MIGWYCLISGLLLLTAIVTPEKVNVGKYGIEAGPERVLMPILFLGGLIWSGLNLLGLRKFCKKCECRKIPSSKPPASVRIGKHYEYSVHSA